MDVNGTRFHLIRGEADWQRGHGEGKPAGCFGQLRVAERDGALTLKPETALFPRGQRDLPLEPEARRGSDVDAFDNWFWIGQDETSIYWLPSGAGRPGLYWDQAAPAPPSPSAEFADCDPEPPTIERLAGLAITDEHYLVAGSPTMNGLIILDLYGGGPPMRLRFPVEPFAPFDIAARPDGGVWILDRSNHQFWLLDSDFRVQSSSDRLIEIEAAQEPDFTPTEGDPPEHTGRHFPEGFSSGAADPIAIEALPDERVLILDRPADDGPAKIWQYKLGEFEHETDLPDISKIVERRYAESDQPVPPVVGHDFAYDPETKRVYVVERDGNQAIAFSYDVENPTATIEPQPLYLPLHRFGSRALVRSDDHLFYDIPDSEPSDDKVVRWARLQPFEEARHTSSGVYLSDIFDGRERDCVWHRLFLDACIPQETSVRVWTRTYNDPNLIENAVFHPEPSPYLRETGSEIPFWDPFAGVKRRESTGTWELLFQHAEGRYMQLRIELKGNGRRTPRIYSLRAYYPRFSYPREFLPGVYLEAGGPTSFLERMLANEEGIFTDLHNMIDQASALFSPQAAPAEALDWLAGWLGLIVDPLWGQIQEVRRANSRNDTPLYDRRRLFISFARKLFQRRGTPDGIMFALLLLLEPELEQMLTELRLAAIGRDSGMLSELARLGLPAPQPSRGEQHYEDLLHDYLLHPERQSTIRLVERFAARAGRAAVAGDPTEETTTGATGASTIAASAHRFSVLIPERLSPEEEAMVTRIVELEKPAHTLFDVRRYWDYFRVGEARLGFDTVLGEGSRWLPLVLGRDDLGAGYLAPAHPYDVTDRVIVARDRLSAMPTL